VTASISRGSLVHRSDQRAERPAGSVLALTILMARRDAGAAALRGVHVLLVCDNVERSALFAQALKYADALVTTSASADDACAVMERVRANVIVVELRASADRARFIAAVRALPTEGGGKIPALVLTRSHDDAESLLAAGFQLHAAMPVRATELCQAVVTLARLPGAWPRL
jgi:CheY-like chemotaxis protein